MGGGDGTGIRQLSVRPFEDNDLLHRVSRHPHRATGYELCTKGKTGYSLAGTAKRLD